MVTWWGILILGKLGQTEEEAPQTPSERVKEEVPNGRWGGGGQCRDVSPKRKEGGRERQRQKRQLAPAQSYIQNSMNERNKNVDSSVATGCWTVSFCYCGCWNKAHQFWGQENCTFALLPICVGDSYLGYFCELHIFPIFFPLEFMKLCLMFLPNLLDQWSSYLVSIRILGIGLPDLAIKNTGHIVKFKFHK